MHTPRRIVIAAVYAGVALLAPWNLYKTAAGDWPLIVDSAAIAVGGIGVLMLATWALFRFELFIRNQPARAPGRTGWRRWAITGFWCYATVMLVAPQMIGGLRTGDWGDARFVLAMTAAGFGLICIVTLAFSLRARLIR